jgi:hypothetical protein
VQPDQLINLLQGVPQVYGTDPRPQQLLNMINQSRGAVIQVAPVSTGIGNGHEF